MSRTFGAESTCDEVLEGVDVTGKHALVTGASGGLGAEAARSLAAHGVHVTLLARDKEKTEGVAASIRDAHPGAQVDIGLMDLSDPDSVNAFADNWLSEHSRLDMLILNAGLMACPLMRNAKGWEMQFATNHLGHFALASKLMPVLLQSAPARVVSLSSAGHGVSPVLLDDPNFEQTAYDPWLAYGQAKTANIWFANELNRRYAQRGINATALHPGVIMTDLSRHLTEETLAPVMERLKERGESTKTIPQGAATSIFAATAPELEGKGGLYLADCQIVDEHSAQHIQYAPHAFDEKGEARLWSMSEQLLGITFGE